MYWFHGCNVNVLWPENASSAGWRVTRWAPFGDLDYNDRLIMICFDKSETKGIQIRTNASGNYIRNSYFRNNKYVDDKRIHAHWE